MVIALALAGCSPQPPARPVAAAQHLPAASPDVAAVLGRHAVNALVLPLLDDDEPPRLTAVALPLLCADESDVRVDGRPLVDGAEAPAGSFVVQWRLAGMCPFGLDGPRLSGAVDVLVLRDDDAGLQALLLPRRATQIARSAP